MPILANDPHSLELRSKIEKILFPLRCKNDNERNDVRVFFGAAYYYCILITNDGDSKTQPGGILGRSKELKEIGVVVMRASEAVQKVRDNIARRDAQVFQASKVGAPIPQWYCKD